ncbi:DUF3352 domain-containing protein [Merismopedia glauca]|uniref:DUF3352 domain-containing protein n=1 Tax=Merismopedia glauca CCAP 1448/3 TaxID=1296344 RepID=A0A2T1BZE3_9CYAN|nr:DUF3352 domain-containing protein [Merismopedia glauca]PSB01362.1 hypothetical protein C7B64_18675 [Merismopedia glauca CCAP 1448/3]
MYRPFLLAAALAASIGAGGCYYLESVRLSAIDPVNSAKYVPETALVWGYLVLDRSRWQQLSQFGTKESQVAFDVNLSNIVKVFDEQVLQDLSWTEDILPTFGSITVAGIPQGKKIGWLIIASISNPGQFWWKLASKSQSQTYQDYQGVRIYRLSRRGGIKSQKSKVIGEAAPLGLSQKLEGSRNALPSDGDKFFWAAKVDNQLLLADSVDVIEQSIDSNLNHQSILSLNQTETALSRIKQERLLFQLYFPNYKLFSPRINSLAISVGVNDSGLKLQQAALFANPNFSEPREAKAYQSPASLGLIRTNGGIIAAIVSDAFGLRQGWQQKLGLDLGITSQVKESSVSLIAASQQEIGGGVSITSNPTLSNRLLADLDWRGKKLGYTIVGKQVGNRRFKTWLGKKVQVPFLGYGYLDSQTIFVALGKYPVLSAVATSQLQPSKSVEIDFPKLVPLLSKTLPEPTLALWKTIERVEGESTSDAEGIRFDLQLKLNRKE